MLTDLCFGCRHKIKMNKHFKTAIYLILLIVFLVFIYAHLIGFVAYLDANDFEIGNRSGEVRVVRIGGSDENVGFNDRVVASVKRDRWYGTIYENEDSYLMLFDTIELPLKVDNTVYTYFHLVSLYFLFMVCLAFLYFRTR